MPESKQLKNRVHLDLWLENPEQELARLESLGAVVLSEQPSPTLTVLADPEGNEFCLLR